MPGSRVPGCTDCDRISLLGRGNGKCSQCFGSGTNVSLNSAAPSCVKCGGSGICSTCQGHGYLPRADTPFRRAMSLAGAVIALALSYHACTERKSEVRALGPPMVSHQLP